MSKMFVSNLPAVTMVINAASAKALRAAADVGRNQTVKNLSGSRSGRVYRLSGSKKIAGGRARYVAGERSAAVKHGYYTASAPGEYPAIQWGNLRAPEGLRIKPTKDGYAIGTPLDYGLFLEKKPTSRGGRPWLKRSLDQAKPAMIAKLAQRWF